MKPTELDDPRTWPAAIIRLVDDNFETLRRAAEGGGSVKRCEKLAAACQSELEPISLRGWHCTRFFEDEIASVRTDGLLLLDSNLVGKKIASARLAGVPEERLPFLGTTSHAAVRNRTGQIWFFFTRDYLGRCVRTYCSRWGGEAYHHDNPENLKAWGTACIVEASVPFVYLQPRRQPITAAFFLATALRTRGVSVPEDHASLECDAVSAIRPDQIIRIHREGDPEFSQLTEFRSKAE